MRETRYVLFEEKIGSHNIRTVSMMEAIAILRASVRVTHPANRLLPQGHFEEGVEEPVLLG